MDHSSSLLGGAFDIDRLVAKQQSSGRSDLLPELYRALADSIDSAPRWGRVGEALPHVVRVIHGIPQLYRDVERGDLEFYVGRAGSTPEHLYNRWRAGLEGGREHHSAITAFRCATSAVTTWEAIAVRVVRQLKARSRLCVANVAAGGCGRVPDCEESVVYLTWRVQDRTSRISTPIRADIDSVARVVADEMQGRVSVDALARGLDPITRPVREREVVGWAKGHKRSF